MTPRPDVSQILFRECLDRDVVSGSRAALMTALLACPVTLESLHLRLTARPWRRAVNPGMFRKIEFPHRCVPSPQQGGKLHYGTLCRNFWVLRRR
jgi:hypothetical protein